MNIRTVLGILVWFVVVCSEQPGTAADVKEILPPRSSGGEWRLAGDNYSYLPDTLYNYINGAADLFISYGFVSLTGGRYHPGPDRRVILTVDVYDMGKRLNAFGVFQSKRDPELRPLTIGAGASGTEKYLFFYKGHWYVEIQAQVLSGTSGDLVMRMARYLEQRIAGDAAPPVELGYLPEDNRVGGSEMYITGGILGHGFLDKGLLSDYRLDGETVKAFVVFFPSDTLAGKALDQYRSYLDTAGEGWQAFKGLGEDGFASREPYHGNILVTRQGAFVAGVADLPQPSRGEALLRHLLRKIQTPFTPQGGSR